MFMRQAPLDAADPKSTEGDTHLTLGSTGKGSPDGDPLRVALAVDPVTDLLQRLTERYGRRFGEHIALWS